MEPNMGFAFVYFSTYLVDKANLVPSQSQLLCSFFARGREKEKKKKS
jgi:hypothetical protein